MKPVVLALVAALSLAQSVSAHSKAKDTTPAGDATVKEVKFIEIYFDDLTRVTAITLTGPGGEVDVKRDTGLDPATEFRAQTPRDMPLGVYSVDWRGLSVDGHPVQGTFGFTLEN